MDKVVYVGTTYKCSACEHMSNIMEEVKHYNPTFELKILDYTELPSIIKDNVLFSDFPITVFVIDEEIKGHFVGTMARRKIERFMENIGFSD